MQYMLQVFHAKWPGRLPNGESSEGCGVVTEHGGGGVSFIPRHSEDRLEIEKLKESLRQQDEKCSGGMKSRGSGMKQRGSEMTSTRQPLLNSRQSFWLVDLTISFSIEHLYF
jgi:hypothetical protein